MFCVHKPTKPTVFRGEIVETDLLKAQVRLTCAEGQLLNTEKTGSVKAIKDH